MTTAGSERGSTLTSSVVAEEGVYRRARVQHHGHAPAFFQPGEHVLHPAPVGAGRGRNAPPASRPPIRALDARQLDHLPQFLPPQAFDDDRLQPHLNRLSLPSPPLRTASSRRNLDSSVSQTASFIRGALPSRQVNRNLPPSRPVGGEQVMRPILKRLDFV